MHFGFGKGLAKTGVGAHGGALRRDRDAGIVPSDYDGEQPYCAEHEDEQAYASGWEIFVHWHGC